MYICVYIDIYRIFTLLLLLFLDFHAIYSSMHPLMLMRDFAPAKIKKC